MGSGYCPVMSPPRPTVVTLCPDLDDDPQLAALVADADDARGDVRRALEVAERWGPRLPPPGRGRTALLWSALATLGSVDLTVARVLEPHLDALAILDSRPAGVWGVWAAEGPGVRLRAEREGAGHVLTGRKPWCSLAGDLTHALVTAWVDDERRQLFVVDLRQPSVTACRGAVGVARAERGPQHARRLRPGRGDTGG